MLVPLLLTLLLTAVSMGVAQPGSAAVVGSSAVGSLVATASSQNAGVTLSRVTPTVATPEQPVSIAGLLDVAALGIDLSAAPTLPPTSTTDPGTGTDASPPPIEPVASVDVRLGPADLRSHAAVDDWAAGHEPATGPVLATTDIIAAPDPTVDRLPFAVTVEGIGDRARTTYGVVAVSVEIRLPDAVEPVAVRHTFIGFQKRKEYVPLQLTWLVPFAVPADPLLLGAFGEERTGAWEALVGGDGVLRERLAAARVPHTVWVLDPALLTPGPAPAPAPDETGEPTETDGPETTSPAAGQTTPAEPDGATSATGTDTSDENTTSASTDSAPQPPTEPGQPVTQAETEHLLRAEFAQELLEAADGRDILLLPMHDADIAALPPADATGSGPTARRDLISAQLDVDEAHTLLTEHGARVLPTLWPADLAWGQDRDAALRGLPLNEDGGGATEWSVLADPSSLASTARGPVTASSGTGVLPVDAVLSTRASAATDGSALETGLALMADTLVTLNDRPGTARHLVVLPDRKSPWLWATGELTTVLAGVPWIKLTSLGLDAPGSASPDIELVETADDSDTATQSAADPASVAAPPVLDDVRAEVLHRTLDRLPTAASVRAGTGTGSGGDLSTRGADSLAQLSSLRWRGDAEGWQTAYQPIADAVAATFSGLVIPSRDVTFLADTGLLRVTVENSLETDITDATLDLVVDHPILRIESGAQPVEVGAGSRTTVGFEASSIATGRVQITATLRAPDGTVLAEPTTFTVRVSPTSDWIYWVLLALAGGVIVIGIVRTVLRRRPSTRG